MATIQEIQAAQAAQDAAAKQLLVMKAENELPQLEAINALLNHAKVKELSAAVSAASMNVTDPEMATLFRALNTSLENSTVNINRWRLAAAALIQESTAQA